MIMKNREDVLKEIQRCRKKLEKATLKEEKKLLINHIGELKHLYKELVTKENNKKKLFGFH